METDATPRNSKARDKLKEHLYDKINSGWPLPCGWLFDGLVFYFPQLAHQRTTRDVDRDHSPDDDFGEMDDLQSHHPLQLTRNTARFAGARVVDTAQDPAITHVILQPTGLPVAEYRSLREPWAAAQRIPHFVTTGWVEESWRQQTLLDEERESPSSPPSPPGLCFALKSENKGMG